MLRDTWARTTAPLLRFDTHQAMHSSSGTAHCAFASLPLQPAPHLPPLYNLTTVLGAPLLEGIPPAPLVRLLTRAGHLSPGHKKRAPGSSEPVCNWDVMSTIRCKSSYIKGGWGLAVKHAQLDYGLRYMWRCLNGIVMNVFLAGG